MKKIVNQALSFSLVLILFATVFPLAALATEGFKEVEATAALLVDVQMDAKYDTVLYEKNAHEKRYPASITKVMTALLVVEAIERGELKQDTMLTASELALADITDDSSTQNIKPGEQMSVEDLLYCLMTASANEAGNILAEGVSGSVPSFVDAMNVRAQELGMTGTQFLNPHGLHRDEHYSTAYDIYLMTRVAMEHPLFQRIAGASSHTTAATNMAGERKFHTTNALLSNWRYVGYLYGSATGVKTGHTPEAGYCLVSSANEDGRSLIAVVLGAETVIPPGGSIDPRQFSESLRLLKWGFSNFKVQTLLSGGGMMPEIQVAQGELSYVLCHPAETIRVILPVSYNPELLTTTVNLTSETVTAPVYKGEVLGSVTVTYDGTVYGMVDLVAVNDVGRSNLLFVLAKIQAFLGSIIVRVIILVLILVVVLRYVIALRRKPRRGSKKSKHPGKPHKPNRPRR